jgi:hypothetical protein
MFKRFMSRFRPKDDERIKLLAAVLNNDAPGATALIIDTTRELTLGLDPNGCVMAMVGYKNSLF